MTAAISEDTSVTCYLHASSDSGTHVLMGLVEIGKRRLAARFDNDND